MRTADLTGEFPALVRERGTSYHRGGAVKLDGWSSQSIRARARGKQDYLIRIEIEGDTLTLDCSCPAAREWGACKHMWATLLVAEQTGVLGSLPNFKNVAYPSWEGPDVDDYDIGAEPAGQFDEVDSALLSARAPPPESRPLFARAVGPAAPPAPPPAPLAPWQKLLDEARRVSRGFVEPPPSAPPAELLYVVEGDRGEGSLIVSLRTRSRKKSGGWGKDKPASIAYRALDLVGDAMDRRILPLFHAASSMGSELSSSYYEHGYGYGYRTFATGAAIPPSLSEELLPLLSDTGRFYLRQTRESELAPLRYEGGAPWEFVVQVLRRADGQGSDILGRLRRGDDTVALSEPSLLSKAGWIVLGGRLGRLRDFGGFTLLELLRRQGAIPLPLADEPAFVARLFAMASVPRLDLPADLAYREVAVAPARLLKIGPPAQTKWGPQSNRLTGQLTFSYDGSSVLHHDPRDVIADGETKRLLRRDRAAEAEALRQLQDNGFRALADRGSYIEDQRGTFDIPPTRLAAAVRALVGAGWRVEAEGRIHRSPSRFHLSVSSGVDWFELEGRADFDGGMSVPLPRLLRALRRGDRTILLDDGSVGMLPEDWLQRYGLLGDVGTADGDRLRFQPAQVGLLDALLAAEPEVAVDQLFAKARDQLRTFERVGAEPPPPGFRGELRPYQQQGLGWLSFLRRFGFGGCLADDMGLGKTVQVLAMLAARREAAAGAPRPSLIVVPKSLVWNWQQEAARFTPGLRVLAHVGLARAADAPALARAAEGADIVLTTYGLLRKDAPFLRELAWDYVILDEAQAIKNADSESAKAARLLRGDQRLALSGTPIENHVGELWSLIDFLNPGMLGGSRVLAGASGNRRLDRDELAVLARALRPFILRRTKEQVAPELPAKHEETILCEMEPEQRRLYDELRAHYREKLLGRIAREGLGKAKIQVLEALLRLRQAACHPGLVDAQRAQDGSAKLDVLLARLDEVRREGHKALVFSQFTSFLGLVRARLDAGRVPYQYLDGKTRDRQACVDRFQQDAQCGLFLISLKAGGVGLNLTAADYVFILDPWWNPAVEAQAVDRAHRIGQDKRVFVYRLLCKDSVEEKVAALQEQKRDLAAAIIEEDGGLLKNLDRETLELLLA